jgi:LacI family transcriptional regulator
MPNQRAIAAKLGLNQASVSLALRGDPSIPEKTRDLVIKTAAELGYRPNALVSSLMTHIRSGRPLRERGCIALLFTGKALSTEYTEFTQTFQRQYTGIVRRAEELGFRTENFFLGAPGMNMGRINRIIRTRGIKGLVLIPPGHAVETQDIQWENYACATIAYSWASPETHRVATDHRHHVDVAYQTLIAQGYKRIGFCLPPEAVEGVNGAWTDRFLLWTRRLALKRPIPLFVGKPGLTPLSKFKQWFSSYKPDALITLIGHENDWLVQMGLRTPVDLSIVCLNRPIESRFSGMEENHEVIGAATAELAINQILHNEQGLPAHPRLILIKGTWRTGETLVEKH